MTDTSKKPAPIYDCTTKGCPSKPFRLGFGAGGDPKGQPRCGACYQWIRRWLKAEVKANPKADLKRFPEPPARTAAERPVAPGTERRRIITAYVLPELDDLLTARQKERGFKRRCDLITHELARIVKRKDLGPRKPRKPATGQGM